jgi:hypothetical protein
MLVNRQEKILEEPQLEQQPNKFESNDEIIENGVVKKVKWRQTNTKEPSRIISLCV